MSGKVFECQSCGEEIIVPDTVPEGEVNSWLEDHKWKPDDTAAPIDDEWLCEDCSGDETDL